MTDSDKNDDTFYIGPEAGLFFIDQLLILSIRL